MNTVQASFHVCKKNARTHAWLLHHALGMQSAQFTTAYPFGQCHAPAFLGIQEKEMNIATKSVSYKTLQVQHFFRIFVEKCSKRTSFYLVLPEPVGCTSDPECSPNEACDNGNCINPCVASNPCSSTAACYVSNHAARCKCPPGFTGDPYSRCVQSKQSQKMRARI